ncbi:MAG TPA: hypothetical protein VNO21_20295 [Polyangiaceae bacterium]|nr:hypothetical protein [Polyangiaceae bacterium]
MKRAGKTQTITISVDRSAEEFARAEADRLYNGNVSKFFAALLREAERLAAMDRVLAMSGHPPPTEAELDALRAEIAGKPIKRKKRAA